MPLLWLSAVFLLGIAFANSVQLAWPVWAGLAATGILMALLEARFPPFTRLFPFLPGWRRALRFPSALLLAALCGGALRYELAQPQLRPDLLYFYNDSGWAEIHGVVADQPDRRVGSTHVLIEAESIQPEGGEETRVSGQALAMLPPGSELRYGDRVVLWGEPATPPELIEFDYRTYLTRQGIYTSLQYPGVRIDERDAGGWLTGGIYAVRDRAYRAIQDMLPPPESSLLSGILLGLENDIPEPLYDAFRATGTAHIIAISGFNIAMLVVMFSFFLKRLLPHFWVPVGVAVLIGGYAVLAGGQASVVRAAIMGCLALFGRVIGRRSAGANTLTLTGAVMALDNPHIVWDIGFQLSFTATLGLVLFASPMQAWLERSLASRLPQEKVRKITGPVSEYFLFTLAAQAMTLPVILYHFQRLSLTSVLINPLVLPVQPLIMTAGGLATLAGMILPWAGQAAGLVAWPLLAYTIRMVEAMGQWQFGQVATPGFSLWAVAGWYAALFGLVYGKRWLSRGVFRSIWQGIQQAAASPVSIAVAAALAACVWQAALTRPDGRLHVTVSTEPEGVVLLIETPGGSRVWAGGLQDPRSAGTLVARRLPLLGQRLEAAVIPSGKARGLQGLPGLFEMFPPELVWWTPGERKSDENLQKALRRQRLYPQEMAAGQVMELGDGIRLQAAAQQEGSTALLLEWGEFRVVVPFGVGAEQIRACRAAQLRGPSVLVLGEDDLEAAPLEDWQGLAAQVIVRPGAGAAPEGTWYIEPGGRVKISTDGDEMWIEMGK